MNILNDKEFEDFIKPLKEMDNNIHNCKINWIKFVKNAEDKALLDFDMNEYQTNIFNILMNNIGDGMLELIKIIEKSEKDLTDLNDKLK